MKQLTCMVAVLITVAYIAIGGIVFHVFEYENEALVRDDASTYFLRFLENKTCLSQEELGQLLKVTLEAYKTGYLVSNSTDAEPNWDYYSSIFFAITVITTIGYGNISPVTVPGRIFCTCFALVGIPLFLVTVSAIGERLYWLMKKSQGRCFQTQQDGSKSKGAKICGGIFYIFLGMGFFILIPGAIFMLMEGWSFLEGAYYSFITLTTIGFGDYVAGTKEKMQYKGFRGIYRLCVAAWIFVGLSWMAGIISAMQEFYSKPGSVNDPEEPNKSLASRNSQDESKTQRELMRVYSLDSGYSGMNGTKQSVPYNKQISYTSISNDSSPQIYNEVESEQDVYLTKL